MKTQDLINIIDSGESPVFMNREVFEMDYIPDIYKYRDEQLGRWLCTAIRYLTT